MVKFNLIILFVAPLVSLVIGFIWYHPKVFGNAWIKASGVDTEKAKKANMPLVFGLTYLLSLFACAALHTMVIHQMHLFSLVENFPDVMKAGSEANNFLTETMAKYGNNFRTFKHGALHGTLTGIFFVLPIIGINALFEQKGFKYIAINTGYWIVTLAIMGGLVCGFPGA
jgi:hypothetical protein